MSTLTETRPARQSRKPRPKPARSVRMTVPLSPDESGVIIITVGKEMTPYFIDKIPSDFGRAFSLQKFDGEEYAVNLGDNDGGPSCECKGHLRWHGTPNAAGRACKHIDALRALVNAGKL